MIGLLLSLFMGVSAQNDCVPVTTTICSPMSNFRINTTQLSLVYGTSVTAENWESIITDYTSGSESQMKMWQEWIMCTGYTGELIQYYRTYTCLTDIYSLSAGCNNPSVSICDSVCDDYGSAVSTLLENQDACPLYFGNYDSHVYMQVLQRKHDAMMGTSSCKAIIADLNVTESVCNMGIDSDASTCGFAGHDEIAQEYCSDFPSATCCAQRHVNVKPSSSVNSSSPSISSNPSIESHPHRTSFMDKIHRVAMIWGIQSPSSNIASSANGANSPLSFTASSTAAQNDSFWDRHQVPIIAIIGSILAVLTIAGIVALVLRQRRLKHARRTTSRFKSVDTKDDTPFITTNLEKLDTFSKSPDQTITTGKSLKWRVFHAFTPSLPDEVKLNIGDIVDVEASYEDGWAKAHNLTSGLSGACPMGCLEAIQES